MKRFGLFFGDSLNMTPLAWKGSRNQFLSPFSAKEILFVFSEFGQQKGCRIHLGCNFIRKYQAGFW